MASRTKRCAPTMPFGGNARAWSFFPTVKHETRCPIWKRGDLCGRKIWYKCYFLHFFPPPSIAGAHFGTRCCSTAPPESPKLHPGLYAPLLPSHNISRTHLTCPMSIVCRHRLLLHLESQPQVSGMHEGLRLGRRARALAHLRTSAAAWNFTSTQQAATVRVAGLLCLRCSLFRVDMYACFARRLCLSGVMR